MACYSRARELTGVQQVPQVGQGAGQPQMLPLTQCLHPDEFGSVRRRAGAKLLGSCRPAGLHWPAGGMFTAVSACIIAIVALACVSSRAEALRQRQRQTKNECRAPAATAAAATHANNGTDTAGAAATHVMAVGSRGSRRRCAATGLCRHAAAKASSFALLLLPTDAG